MNKKSQVLVTALLCIIGLALIILAIYFIAPLFFNSGTSTDYPYTVEHTKVGWYKLWLKDDHTTVYCFDNERFLPIIEQAKIENKKVAVTYQDYFFKGFWCSSGSERIGKTVITNIEIVNNINTLYNGNQS
jgi:hypothetical protein